MKMIESRIYWEKHKLLADLHNSSTVTSLLGTTLSITLFSMLYRHWDLEGVLLVTTWPI